MFGLTLRIRAASLVLRKVNRRSMFPPMLFFGGGAKLKRPPVLEGTIKDVVPGMAHFGNKKFC